MTIEQVSMSILGHISIILSIFIIVTCIWYISFTIPFGKGGWGVILPFSIILIVGYLDVKLAQYTSTMDVSLPVVKDGLLSQNIGLLSTYVTFIVIYIIYKGLIYLANMELK